MCCVTERFEGQKPWLLPPHLHPTHPCSGGGPLLLLSVTLCHAHRWCCWCSACRVLLSNTIPPTPWHPPPVPSPLLPDCYSTNVFSTVPFLKLILWRSFFLQCHLLSLPPCSSALAFSISPSFSLQDFHLTPQSKNLHTLFLTAFLSLYVFSLWHLTDGSPNERGLWVRWVRREQGEGSQGIRVKG